MKVKYLRLSKEEKKEVKNKFFKTSQGKYLKKKLIIASLCSIGCLIFGIYNGYTAILSKDIIDIIYSILVFISGIVFAIMINKIHISKLNEYVIKQK